MLFESLSKFVESAGKLLFPIGSVSHEGFEPPFASTPGGEGSYYLDPQMNRSFYYDPDNGM